MSEKNLNVASKLAAVRRKVSESGLKMSGKVNMTLKTGRTVKYDYFELGDFLKPAIKAMDEEGLVTIFSFDKEVATLTITDGANDIIYSVPTAWCDMGSAIQSLGGTITYLRRYLLIMALEITENDMVEEKLTEEKGAGIENKPQGQPGKKSKSKAEGITDPIERLFVTAYEAGYSEPTVRESCKLRLKKEVEQLTPQELDTLTKNYEKMIVPK